MMAYPHIEFDHAALATALEAIHRDNVFTYEADGHIFHAPHPLEQLADLRIRYPQARMLAGSTDVGLWVAKLYRDLAHLIYIGQEDGRASDRERVVLDG